MASKGAYIRELAEKIDALSALLAAAKKVESPSRAKLAKFVGVNPHTLKSVCNSPNSTISTDLETKLATAFGFESDTPTWNDQQILDATKRAERPNYRGRDTSENFRKMMFASWGIGIQRLALSCHRPKTLDADLASFSISNLGQDSDVEQPINVFLHIDIFHAHTSCGRFEYGFGVVNIRINLIHDNKKKVINRIGYGDGIKISDAILKARGNDFEPFWELRAANVTLHGEYVTRADPLCQIVNHEVGDKLEAVLYVRRTDEYLKKNGSPLTSAAKQAVIASLLAKKIGLNEGDSEAYPSGLLRLSSQIVEVERSVER